VAATLGRTLDGIARACVLIVLLAAIIALSWKMEQFDDGWSPPTSISRVTAPTSANELPKFKEPLLQWGEVVGLHVTQSRETGPFPAQSVLDLTAVDAGTFHRIQIVAQGLRPGPTRLMVWVRPKYRTGLAVEVGDGSGAYGVAVYDMIHAAIRQNAVKGVDSVTLAREGGWIKSGLNFSGSTGMLVIYLRVLLFNRIWEGPGDGVSGILFGGITVDPLSQ
jgi:hypothetical protein